MHYPLYHTATYRTPPNLTIKVRNYLLKSLTFGANIKTPNFKLKFGDSKKLYFENLFIHKRLQQSLQTTTEYMYIISFFQVTMKKHALTFFKPFGNTVTGEFKFIST